MIGAEFFPDDDSATSLLQCFCVFWLAFAFKPLGGTVLGLAGEKADLVCAITRFLTTLIMGLLPNSDSLGTAAPLLILARILQGLTIAGSRPTIRPRLRAERSARLPGQQRHGRRLLLRCDLAGGQPGHLQHGGRGSARDGKLRL